jgi:integral membrane protein
MASKALARFRAISLAEGVSYLVLVGIAMPLKYAAGIPSAVRVVGMLHGVLFVAFVVGLVLAARAERWGAKQLVIAMIAALLPLGAFWLERRLRAPVRHS